MSISISYSHLNIYLCINVSCISFIVEHYMKLCEWIQIFMSLFFLVFFLALTYTLSSISIKYKVLDKLNTSIYFEWLKAKDSRTKSEKVFKRKGKNIPIKKKNVSLVNCSKNAWCWKNSAFISIFCKNTKN